MIFEKDLIGSQTKFFSLLSEQIWEFAGYNVAMQLLLPDTTAASCHNHFRFIGTFL